MTRICIRNIYIALSRVRYVYVASCDGGGGAWCVVTVNTNMHPTYDEGKRNYGNHPDGLVWTQRRRHTRRPMSTTEANESENNAQKNIFEKALGVTICNIWFFVLWCCHLMLLRVSTRFFSRRIVCAAIFSLSGGRNEKLEELTKKKKKEARKMHLRARICISFRVLCVCLCLPK